MPDKKCDEGGYLELHEEAVSAAQSTLNNILEKAIKKEVDSQRLYTELSNRVREENAKEAFRDLVKYEKQHQLLLERYRRGEFKKGALDGSRAIDYHIAEYLEQPQVSPDMGLPDIFLLAARREKASHEFYLHLAEIHSPGEVRKMLEKLAAQELAHKQKVELLFNEVAFPQTAGG